MHLVHFAGPIKPEWREALEQNDVEIVSYIPHNAYLVYGSGPGLVKMQAWASATDYVQWEAITWMNTKIYPRARTSMPRHSQKPATDLFAIQLVADAVANSVSLQVIDRLKIEPVLKQARV